MTVSVASWIYVTIRLSFHPFGCDSMPNHHFHWGQTEKVLKEPNFIQIVLGCWCLLRLGRSWGLFPKRATPKIYVGLPIDQFDLIVDLIDHKFHWNVWFRIQKVVFLLNRMNFHYRIKFHSIFLPSPAVFCLFSPSSRSYGWVLRGSLTISGILSPPSPNLFSCCWRIPQDGYSIPWVVGWCFCCFWVVCWDVVFVGFVEGNVPFWVGFAGCGQWTPAPWVPQCHWRLTPGVVPSVVSVKSDSCVFELILTNSLWTNLGR